MQHIKPNSSPLATCDCALSRGGVYSSAESILWWSLTDPKLNKTSGAQASARP